MVVFYLKEHVVVGVESIHYPFNLIAVHVLPNLFDLTAGTTQNLVILVKLLITLDLLLISHPCIFEFLNIAQRVKALIAADKILATSYLYELVHSFILTNLRIAINDLLLSLRFRGKRTKDILAVVNLSFFNHLIISHLFSLLNFIK